MNKNLLSLSRLWIFSVLTLIIQTSSAQEGRLPSAEELEIKNKKLIETQTQRLHGGKNVETIQISRNRNNVPNISEQEKIARIKQDKLNNLQVNKGGPSLGNILVTGPEQDCSNAIAVCNQTYSQSNSYTGYGTQELSSTCLGTNETNSVWYIFTVQNSGEFTFTINTANDYDWALFDITSGGCASVPGATPIRCNFSATYGTTGLVTPVQSGAPTAQSIGASGSPTMSGINVTAGQTFALIVDNYSANTNGYTLTFGSGAGAAQIFDITPPYVVNSSVVPSCTSGSLTLTLSEPISCSSINTSGAGFTITGPSAVTVTGATPLNCANATALTTQIQVNFTTAGLVPGTYTLAIAAGTFIDKCGNANSVETENFDYLPPATITATATPATICEGGSSVLSVSGAPASGATYSWAPGGSTASGLTVTPVVTTTYSVTVNYAGCNQTANATVTIQQAPVVTVNPVSASLCSGTTSITAAATINGAACPDCNYTWSGGSTQVDNSVPSSTVSNAGAGTYNVSVTSSSGCAGNSTTSTITIASPSPSSACNIIYVSPSPSGPQTGTDPLDPTDIVTALSMSACNNSVIKMQIGDYTISNPLSVGSFVTIEGGYNVGFTAKTSAKATSGGFPVQGTRIIRNTSNLQGVAGQQRLVAIDVTPGSSFFRFQDIRIDLPDNAAQSAISNYGIYLGNACHDYDITRCYVYSGNAGSGVNGTNGANGLPGNPGSNGGPGGNGCTSGTYGNGGNGGAGAVGTTAGSGTVYTCGAVTDGTNGADAVGFRNGGGGGGGGTGGYDGRDGAFGGFGGLGGGGALPGINTYSTTGGCSCLDVSSSGDPGSPGADGASVGAAGAAGSVIGGFWVPGSTGGTGNDGAGGGGGTGGGGAGGEDYVFFGCNEGTGSGGGGGGGGGQGGAGGTGGSGGGSTYGIFIFNNGANGRVVDCQIVTGTLGAGGTAGTGGIGGSGGTGGTRGVNNGGECRGGNGGAGGKGGDAKAGGAGQPGEAVAVKMAGGSALVTNTALTMTSQAVITAQNISCINTDLDYTATSTNPNWTDFGTSATPASGSGTPFNNVQYSTLGRKTVTLNSDVAGTIPSQTFTNTASSADIGTTACPAAINNTITVSGYSGTVAGSGITIRVSTNNHTWFNDISGYLIAPGGQILGLFNNRGPGSSCALTNVTFSDAGGAVMGGACPGAGSTLKPETTTYTDCGVTSTITSFGALGAINPNGNWTLRIVDGTGGDGGAGIAVGGWSITFPSASATVNQTDVYTDFTGILNTAPSPGSILAAASTICAGTTSFSSSLAGNSGLNYSWSVSPNTGVVIASPTASSTNIDLPNTGTSTITYTVTLTITSQCCGPLAPITKTIDVYPYPATPAINDTTVCTGSSVTLVATGSGAGASYNWYNVAVGGSPIATGPTYSINPVNANQTYYVDAVNSGGCMSQTRDQINITANQTAAPTAVNATTCFTDTSIVVSVNPVAGVQTFNWYDAPAAGTLLQSNTNNNYSVPVTVAGVYTVYASVTLVGCGESPRTPVTVTVTNNPIAIAPSYTNNDTICVGQSVTMNPNASGGGGAYTYYWNYDGSAGSTLTASPTGTSNFTVVISDGSCSKTFAIPVIVNPALNTTLVAPPSPFCAGTSSAPVIVATASNAGTTINWYSDAGHTTLVATGPTYATTINPAVSGTYTYYVMEQDGQGCSSLDSVVSLVVFANPTVDNTSQSVIAQNCTTQGSITGVTGASAANPLSYSWDSSPVQNTSDLTGVPGGSYTLTVTDNNSCVTTYGPVTVPIDTTSPNVSAGTDQVLPCNPPTAVLNGSSSTAGVSFSWTGPGGFTDATATPTVTMAGGYQLTVTDPSNGCSSSDSVYVTPSTSSPDANAGIGNTLTCSVDTVSLDGSSITPNVSFSWSGPGVVNAAQDTALATVAGTYTLTVTDNGNGCVSTATVVVAIDTIMPVAEAGTAADITCSTSSVSLDGSASTAGVTYDWNGLGGTYTNNSVNPTVNTPGGYQLIVTNPVNGCSSMADSVYVNTNTVLPNVNAGADDTLTCTSNTVTLTGTSSTSGVNMYSWSGPGFTGNTAGVNVTVAGGYNLTVTDSTNGCSASDSVYVLMDGNLPTAFAGADDSLTCLVTGVTLNGSSGNSNVSYSWSGPSGFTANTASTNISTAGTYILTVTDTTNGCFSTDQVDVIDDTTPPVANAGTDTTLTCAITTVNLNGTSNVGTSAYSWSGPSGFTSAVANPSVNTQGGYELTVTNTTNGCVDTDSVFVLLNNAAPNANAGPDDSLTCAVSSIMLNGSSSTPNTTFNWSGPSGFSAATSSASTATAGGYLLTVTDTINGCTATDSVYVNTDYVTPNANAGADDTLTCAATSVNLNGSSANSNVAYSWSGPSGFTSAIANPTTNTAGGYLLTVTDNNNGCTNTDSVYVLTNYAIPDANAGSTPSWYCSTTQATITGSSITPNTSFAWSGPAVVTNNSNTTMVTATGVYTLTVTDMTNGCTNTASLTISADTTAPNVAPVATIISQHCNTPGAITISNVSGTYNFSWSNGATSQSLSGLSSSNYTLTITDPATGCDTTYASYFVPVDNTGATVSLSTSTNASCGGSDGTITITVSGVNPISYNWNNGATTQNLTGLAANNYSVAVTDSNGCVTNAGPFVITTTNFVNADFTASTTNGEAPLAVTFTNSSTGATNYSWNFGNNTTASTVVSPANTYYTDGTYSVVLTASDNGGCSDTAMITIVVTESISYAVPNIFTPNNDGKNDVFKVKGTGLKNVDYIIYNRWGELIYKIENGGSGTGWDGRTQAGQEAETGVYYYIVTITDKNGTVIEPFKGTVTLTR